MKRKQVDNIEELYAKKQAARIKSCTEEVSSVLEKHQCQLLAEIQLGNQSVPANLILSVPVVVRVGLK